MADAARYFLGLDAGNTVIKAVLFDCEGQQVAVHALDGHSVTPEAGHVERDLNELWANARTAISGCLAAARVSPGEIAGIGCAGHGNGLYLLDRAGDPLAGIQSLDTRAAALATDLAHAKGNLLHNLCLQMPWPAQTPTLLAWVKKCRPDLYEATGTVLFCKDFITFKLTGERISEISDMSGAGLLRMPGCTYDDTLLSLYGIADVREKLPPLIQPSEIAGRVTREAAEATGLAEGTPVIGGYFDVVSSALGSGVVRTGEASIIAGSWSINQVFSQSPVVDPSVFMVSGFAPGRFVNMDNSATSAANLEWYVRELVERGAHLDDPFGFVNDRLSKAAPRSDDPFFLPFLYGSGQGAAYRAGFLGLAGWHGEGHLLRALFEGVMLEHRRHIGVLEKAGLPFARATLSGGGSRSPHWPQMFADGLGVPIRVAEASETGALGAAIGVALAVREVGNYEEGVDRMTRPKAELDPNPGMKAHYDSRYAAYLDLTERLRGFWPQLAPRQTSQDQ